MKGYSSDTGSVVHSTVFISLRTGEERLPLAGPLKFKARKVENENFDSLPIPSMECRRNVP